LPYLYESSAFFSFGTNDLTQMTYGLSRDDAEELFLKDYIDQRIFPSDPFQTLDQEGVGRLMRIACREGRAANPDLTLGLCGEHGAIRTRSPSPMGWASITCRAVPQAWKERGWQRRRRS